MTLFEKIMLSVLIPATIIEVGILIWYVMKTRKEIGTENTLKLLGWDKDSRAAAKQNAIAFLKESAKSLKDVGVWLVGFLLSLSKGQEVEYDFDTDGGMLWYNFTGILAEYAFKLARYSYGFDASAFPAFVYVSFYTQHAVTDEVKQELIWHFTNAVKENLLDNSITAFDLYPICKVDGHRVDIRIYYNTVLSRQITFETWKDRQIHREIGGAYAVLEEDEIKPLLKRDKVFVGVDANKRALGMPFPLYWDKEVPHCLLCGSTGGGKSVLAQVMVLQLLKRHADVVICDYKGGKDWCDILPSDRFAMRDDCDRIFDEYYKSYQEVRATSGYQEKILIFDEVGSWLMDKDRADKGAYTTKLQQLVSQGRAFGFHIIVIMQQPNADLIGSLARDSLGFRVHMGQISPVTARMIFPDEEIDVAAPIEKYCGYIHISGDRFRVLQTARVADVEQLKDKLEQLGKAYYTD